MSGYFLGEREELEIKYVENKVLGIMKKLFGWIIFWTVVHFIRVGEVYDLWENLTGGAVSRGILPTAWFLFTYCFLMILGYPFYHLRKKYGSFFDIGVLIWMVILASGFGKSMMQSCTQALWFHLYGGYFCLGMFFSRRMKSIEHMVKRKYQIVIVLCMNAICLAIYLFHVITDQFAFTPNSYYGKWYYSLWLFFFFWLFSLVRVENEVLQNLVSRMSSNALVTYLAPHLPTLYLLARIPLENAGMAVFLIILFFAGTQILAEGFRRIPLLRKLV